MKIYLAHNFAARLWLREYAVPLIRKYGHEVTSRWVLSDEHVNLSDEACAVADLTDVSAADWLFLFIDQYSERPGLGKFIEFGFALRAGKKIVLIGDGISKSVFYSLPNLRHAHSLEEGLKYL